MSKDELVGEGASASAMQRAAREDAPPPLPAFSVVSSLEIMAAVHAGIGVKGASEARLLELVALFVARHWGCDYLWLMHECPALEAGLPRDLVTAIREGMPVPFTREDEKIAWKALCELMEGHALSAETYADAVRNLGLPRLSAILDHAGRYTHAAMMIKAFDIAQPGAPAVF